MYFNSNAIGSAKIAGITSRQCEGTEAISVTGIPASEAQELHNGHSTSTRTCTDNTCSSGTIQSRLALYRVGLVEHSVPPRCIISDSKLVRAIEVTKMNRLRNVGGTRFILRCVIFVISSIARPMASDSFVEI